MTEEELYNEAFRQMSTTPLEPDENPGPEAPTSIRLSPATRRQIAWLSEQGHGNRSVIIAKAVQMMAALEAQLNAARTG